MASDRNYGPVGAPGATVLGINTQGTAVAPLPAKVAGTVTTEQVVLNPATSTAAAPAPLLVQIPSDSVLEQRTFDLVASGYITAGAAGNVTVNLYEGTSATVGNDILLKSSGAIAYAGAATAPFWVKGHGIYDSVSGKLQGTAQFFINGTLVAEAAFTNSPTGINDQSNPVASFLLSVTFSVANAANLLVVQEFAVNF